MYGHSQNGNQYPQGDYFSEIKTSLGNSKQKTGDAGDTSRLSFDGNQLRLIRSNSLGPDNKPLSISDRNTEQTDLTKDRFEDISVIAVYSREAFEHFGKRWKNTMSLDESTLATKSSLKNIPIETEAQLRLGRQSKTFVGSDFQAQQAALFEEKTVPHVIAVIEGKEEMHTFTLKVDVDKIPVVVTFSLKKYVQGKNSNNWVDNKQSMMVYVRNDMSEAYSVSKEEIMHINNNNKHIPALGINYETQDGTRYRTLLVHIPNEFVGTATKVKETHDSFQKYADGLRNQKDPVVVTTYFGDTNYKDPITKFSVPSMGGLSLDRATLNPQSSSAKNETNFMQSVPLNSGKGKHSVLQPSVLNYVFINPDDSNREGTDHPSFIQYVAHDSLIKGRPR